MKWLLAPSIGGSARDARSDPALHKRPRGVLALILLAGAAIITLGAEPPTRPSGADAFEPNNTADKATPLTFDNEISATIYPRGDHDFYQFTLDTSARVTIKATAPSPAICLLGRLNDAQGRNLAQVGAGPGRNLLMVMDLRAGTYTLELRDGPHQEFESWRGSDAGESKAPYRLLVSAEKATGFKASADPAKAPLIESGKTYSVCLFPAGEQLYFKIKVPEPGLGELRLTATHIPEHIALAARITPAGGRGEDHQAALGKPLAWSVRTSKPGEYLILLHAGSYQQRGVWKSADSDSSLEPIEFKAEFLDAGDAFEPNNDFPQAAPLATGKTISATLFPAGDFDYYKVNVPEGKRGFIRADVSGLPDNIHGRLAIFGGDRREQRAIVRDHGKPLTLIHGVGPGDYYLLVQNATFHNGVQWEGADWNGSRTPYELRVSFISATTDEREPNDTFETAEEIAPGQSRRCALLAENDYDTFRFTLKEGDVDNLQIVVSGLNFRTLSRVWLYDKDRREIDSTRINRDGYHVLNCRLAPSTYYFMVGPQHGSNGAYEEGTGTQFQTKPYHVALLPRHRTTLPIDKDPHHLGDQKVTQFAKPEPDGLTFKKTIEVRDPAEHDVVLLNARYLRNDISPQLASYLVINGKEIAWINRYSPWNDQYWRTLMIDLPAGALKAGANEIEVRVSRIEGQGADNWEFKSLALGRRLFYQETDKGPAAVTQSELAAAAADEASLQKPAALALGKWNQVKADKSQRDRWLLADLKQRGALRILLPGPHMEVEPAPVLYRAVGDFTRPLPRVLYLHGSGGNRSQLDQQFPELAFTSIYFNAKEAAGALLDLPTLLSYDAVIIDVLGDVSQFDFASEKAQANLKKFAESGKRILIVDPLCSLEKLGVKNAEPGSHHGMEHRTIDLPTTDPMFAGERGRSIGWTGPERGSYIDNWKEAGLVSLAGDLTDPEKRSITAYRAAGKGAFIYETLFLGHPDTYPHARPRLQWLLGLSNRLEYVGSLSDIQYNAARETPRLLMTAALPPGQYLLRIPTVVQGPQTSPLLVRSEFIPSASDPGAPGTQFTSARPLEVAEKSLKATAIIDELEREQWFKLSTTRQKGASVRVEAPEELDLALDLYRGEAKPTGKRVLYLHGPYPEHNLDQYFPDVTWQRREWNGPQAARALLPVEGLKQYDAIVVDAINSMEQFGLNQPAVLKNVEDYVQGGGRFIVLTPVCALTGFGIKSENAGNWTTGKSICVGDAHELLDAYKGRPGALHTGDNDEMGAFSNWSQAGYAPLFRHGDNAEQWATAVVKKAGKGYYIFDSQQVGWEPKRGKFDWKVYLYLGITPAWEHVRTIHGSFERTFGSPQQFELPAEDAQYLVRVCDWRKCHRSLEPFTLTVDPVIASPPRKAADTRETATAFPFGKTVQGRLFPAGARDFYRLEVDARGMLSVYLDHPADNIDAELTLISKEVPPKKVLYLRGGRADYDVHRRRLGGVEFTVLDYWDARPLAGLLAGNEVVILDGLTNPAHFGMNLPATQQAILKFVESGGTFVLLCPQFPATAKAKFWDVELAAHGFHKHNLALVDGQHPLHHRRASGMLGGWPVESADAYGHFVGWKEAGFARIYADKRDPEKSATLLAKSVGKGLLVLDALEIGYAPEGPSSLWHLANLVDAPPEEFLDPQDRSRRGIPRFDQRIIKPGTYYLTVADNARVLNYAHASPQPYTLRADFLSMPDLVDTDGPPEAAAKAPATTPATAPATGPATALAGPAALARDLMPGMPSSVPMFAPGRPQWLRFATPSPGKAALALTEVPDSIDPVVEIYRAADLAKPFLRLNNTTGKAYGGPEHGGFETGASETFYVKVYDREGVRTSLAAMKLQVDLAPIDTPWEPNNDDKTATLLLPDHTYSNSIFPARDVDYFRFTASEKSTLEVTASNLPADLALRIQLFSAENLRYSLRQVEGKPGENVTLKADLPKAGAYLLVMRAGADGAPSPQLFQFTAKFKPSEALPPVSIAGQWPAPDLLGCFPEAPIKVAFNKPVKADAVENLISASGSKSGKIAGKTALDEKTSILTFTPAAPFAPGEQVSISLGEVQDVEGKKAPAGAKWAFAVGSPRVAETVVQVSLPRRKLGAGKHAVVLSSTWPLAEAPGVVCKLSDGAAIPAEGLLRKDDGKWYGTITLSAGAANGPAKIEVSGKDSLGRKIQRVAGNTTFEVSTATPPAMAGVTLEQRPQGKIAITWARPHDVPTVAGYRVFRAVKEGASDSERTVVAEIASALTTASEDLPPADGIYFYAIAAVDDAGNQGPLSPYARGTSMRTGPKVTVADFAGKVEKEKVTLTWRKSADAAVVGYDLHRFSKKEDAEKAETARPYRSFGVDDQQTVDVPGDGEYYYRISARDAAGNSGPLSPVVKLVVDTQPAHAAITLSKPPPVSDGEYVVSVRLNEKLKAPLRLRARMPAVNNKAESRELSVKAVDDLNYQATFKLDKQDPDGDIHFVAEGEDLYGNQGVVIDSGGYFYFDNAPPHVRIYTDPAGRFKAGKVNIRVDFSEPVAADPTFAYSVGGKSFPLSLKKESEQRYRGVMELGKDAPNGPAKFEVVATDRFGHKGAIYDGDETFVIKTAPPEPPTALRVRIAAAGAIEVRWNPPIGAAAAEFFRLYVGEAADFQVGPKTLAQDNIHEVMFLYRAKEEKPLFLRVTSVDAAGNESKPTDAIKAQPRSAPPQAPTDVIAQLQKDGQVKISWKADAIKEPVSFQVYRSSDENPDLAKLNPLATTREAFAFDKPPAAGSFYYHVTSQDFAGNPSKPVRSAKLDYDVLPPTAALQLSPVVRTFRYFGPNDVLWELGAINAGKLQVTISFSKPLAEPPQLRYKTKLQPAPRELTLTQKDQQYTGEIVIEPAKEDGLLQFFVTAKDRAGNTGHGFTVGERFWVDSVPPEAPAKLTVEKLPLGKLAISWPVPAGEAGDRLRYHLYRSSKPIASVKELKELATIEREIRFVDSPAEEGEYHYAVVVEDIAGNFSPVSADATSVSKMTPPPPPSSLTATLDRQVLLAWKPSPEKGARYRVYRATSSEVVAPKNRIADEVTATNHVDLPQTDATFYYGVTAIDGSGNESAPTNVAKLDFTGKVPRATIVTDPKGIVRQAFKVTLTSTLPLVEPPQLFLQQPGRSDTITLRKIGADGKQWEGNLTLPDGYPDGPANFSFRGVAAGNFSGTTIDNGGELVIDTRPPEARVSLARPSPLPSGTHALTLTASEPLAAAPQLLLVTLGAKPRKIDLEKVDAANYRGNLTLTGEDHDGTAVFIFQGTDLAGNEARIENLPGFEVSNHVPKPPAKLEATTLAAGDVQLKWAPPVYQAHEVFDQIGGYNVYRSDKPIEHLKDLKPVQTGIRASQVNDRPDKDGDYFYAVATVHASGLVSLPSPSIKAHSDRTPPAPPRIVALKQLPTGIDIAWESGEPGKNKYTVVATLEGQREQVTVVKDHQSTQTQYHPLVSGNYIFRVMAVDEAGNSSEPSLPSAFAYQQLAPVAQLAFSRPVPWGEGPVEISLTANLPLAGAPKLTLAAGKKLLPVELSGSGTQWKGKLNVERSLEADRGEFRFSGIVKHQGADLEGAGILEGREVRFDFVPPSIAIDFVPAVPARDRLVLLKAGRHTFNVTSSKPLKDAPKLAFTPTSRPSMPIGLTEAAPLQWQGALVVDEKLGDGAGLFEVTVTDLQGNSGKEITRGRNVLVRTHAPSAVGKLRAVALPKGRIRLDWTPPLRAGREVDTSANHFRLYRSDGKIRSIEGMTPIVELHRALGHIDTPPLDRDYFYTVVTVDEAGNASEPVESVSARVDKTPPSPPRNLQVAELKTGTVKLAWQPPTGKRAAFYRVYLEKSPIKSTAGLHPMADAVPFTEVYGSPNENGSYYFAVTAVDESLNESAPSNVVFHDYKSIAPLATFAIFRGRRSASAMGTLTIQTISPLPQPPQLMVKESSGEPRRITLMGDGRSWSARIAPAAIFKFQSANGAETSYMLELTVAQPLAEAPRVFFNPEAGEPRPIAFDGKSQSFTATLAPRAFFSFDPKIWLTDGSYTVSLWTTAPLREPPKVMVHCESRPPQPLAFTGSGDTWEARLEVDRNYPEGQYGFVFEGTDTNGNPGSEIREGPLFRVDRKPPLSPEKLQAIADDKAAPGGVRVRWSPPQQAGAEIPHYYRIYRSRQEFSDPAAAEMVHLFRVIYEGKDSEEITDVPPENGQWVYRITALDLAGNPSPPSELAKVTVSTRTPRAQIRLATPQSGDAPALRVGKSGAAVVLTTNVPLKAPPKVSWFRKAKPNEKHDLPLAGSGTRFEGTLRPDAPEEVEEDAQFTFTGISSEGIEGKAIASGQDFTIDNLGPEARIIIPSVYEMKIVVKPEGGGELKVPPVQAGRIKVNVEVSEVTADVPQLTYALDGGAKIPVPLTGFGRMWSGWMEIPPGIEHAQGKLQFKAVDLAGNVSTRITPREYPREVDEAPIPRTLRNFATTGGEFEVDSVPPAAPTSLSTHSHKLGVAEIRWQAAEGTPWTYRLYRALTPLSGAPPQNAIKKDILARVIVDDPPVDGNWFYAVTAVDLAGNESPMSQCGNLFVDSIKPELKIKAVTDGEDFVILFPEEDPITADVTLRFPGQKEMQVKLGGESGQLKKVIRQVNGKSVPGYVLPRQAEFFNGKVEVIVHSPDPEGNRVEAVTQTEYKKITTDTGGEVESPDGSARFSIPAGYQPVIPTGPKESKRVGGYDNLFFVSYERIPETAVEAAKSDDPRQPDPLPPGLEVVGAPYTIHLNEAPKEPVELKSAVSQADLSGLKPLLPKLTMKIPQYYSDVVKDPEYLKSRLKVMKWVPTREGNKRGRWELVRDIEIKPSTGEIIAPADSVTSYVIVSERTPPIILDASPEPNGATRSMRPEISARIVDKGTGVATGAENPIVLTIDGQKVPSGLLKLSTDDPTEVKLTYTPGADLSAGMHLVSLRAEDVVGNVANYQWRFTVNDVPPAVTSLWPAEGAIVAVQRPILSAKLADEGGIDAAATRLSIDGVEVTPAELQFDESTGLLTWLPAADLAAGEHKAQLIAADRTGQTTKRDWAFTIDQEPPGIEAPEIRDSALRILVRDRLGSIDSPRLRLWIDGEAVGRSEGSSAPGFAWQPESHTLSYPLPADRAAAKLIVAVLAQDTAGNSREARWAVKAGEPAVAIDLGGPTVAAPRVIARAESRPASQPATAAVSAGAPADEESSNWPAIFGVLVLVLAAGAATWMLRKRRSPGPT